MLNIPNRYRMWAGLLLLAVPQAASAQISLDAPVPPLGQIEEVADPVSLSELEEVYKLRPLDKVSYSILEDPVKSTQPEELTVSSLGELSFRVTRGAEASIMMDVRDKTLGQIREELKARLDADYYHNSTIHLRLKTISPSSMGKVLISGEVRAHVLTLAPGEKKTLFEAILQVGASRFAQLKKVKLSRVNPATGEDEISVIDVEAIRKDRTKDILLMDGDRIDVPERGIIF